MNLIGYSRNARRCSTRQGLIYVALLLLVSFKPASSFTNGAPPAGAVQNKIVVLEILNFQDETDSGAPPELGRKIAQQLKQRLALSFKDIVPKSMTSDSAAALSVEQAVALGKQNAVQFVVRGGLLALTNDQSNVTARLYAEIISVETGTVSVVNADGAGTGNGTATAGAIQWSDLDLNGASFASSAPGSALSSAIESLADSIHESIVAPAPTAESSGEATADQASADQASTDQASAVDTAAAEADDELRQLIAQAEEIVANGSGDSEQLKSVSLSLQKLKTALASKASVIEAGGDSTTSDQEVAAAKTEMQAALTAVTEQSASSSSNSEEGTQPTGEKKSLLGAIDQRAGEALSLLQKIQELRSAFKGGGSASEGTGQSTEDVSGVVMEGGQALAGVEVTDQSSGVSAITGPDGSYTLKSVPTGKLSNLVLKKNGKQLAKGQINVMRGRPAVADFELKTNKGASSSAMRIVPSAVVLKSNSKGATGSLKGTAKDQAGKPLPRALVSLNRPDSPKNQSLPGFYTALAKNEAMVRTDSQGRYKFLAVPPGDYLVTIQKSGSKSVSTRVSVKPNVAVEVQSQLTTTPQSSAGNRQRAIVGGTAKTPTSGGPNPIVVSRDRALNTGATGDPALTTGSSTRPRNTATGALQGQVVDASNRKAIAGATVSITGRRVRTDQSGKFEFEDLSPGVYRVKVISNGFSEDEQSVTIRAGATSRDQFALKPLEDPKRTVRVVPEASRPTTAVRLGQIRGRVVDAASGAPIVGAVVAVSGQQRAITGRDGSYSLSALPPGSHQVSISKVGFIDKRTSITIRPGEVTDASFRLAAMTRKPN